MYATIEFRKLMGISLVLLGILSRAPAQYNGGDGTARDPYQIATAADLIALGESPEDYDKHFILTADIDLDANLPAKRVFDKAIIAPDSHAEIDGPQGIPFTGVLDGDGHRVSHLAITGGDYLGLFGRLELGAMIMDLGLVDIKLTGSGKCAGGLVAYNAGGHVIRCHSTGRISGRYDVGGVVGWNCEGDLTRCRSTASVSGERRVGGLAGLNSGGVTNCYSTGSVTGTSGVGGLVGSTSWSAPHSAVSQCYSTGTVKGNTSVGGLVGSGSATACFWDIETSGQTKSAGGTGKTTAQMQTGDTFLAAGWDFLGETANGTEDIWWITDGQGYPKLAPRLAALSPYPQNGAIGVSSTPILSWLPGVSARYHDIYFGENEMSVTNATPETVGIFMGRQTAPIASYDPGVLELGRTYYWRIDEVGEANRGVPWKSSVWSFTTRDCIPDFIVVDDFQSYTDDEGERIYEMWIDGWTNGTGSQVGFWGWGMPTPAWEWQSMPLEYNNVRSPYYSETYRTWNVARDWTIGPVSDLSLRIIGQPVSTNSPDTVYVTVQDRTGKVGVATHRDPSLVNVDKWTQWRIPMSIFTNAGVDLTAVKRVYIGVGGRDNPQPSGSGKIWIDDIRVVRSTAVDANLVGWWPFDEGSGTVAHDYSGNICDGAIVGATWAEGVHGGALDSAGSYVDIPPEVWATIETQATVAFWAYTRPGASFVFGAFQDAANGSARVMSVSLDNNRLYFDTGGTTADGYDRIFKVIDAADYENTWTHWTFVKNAETGEQQIYLNGVLWHSETGLTRTMTGVTQFTIGRHPDEHWRYHVGLVDDFRLYDRALEAREIKLLAAPFDVSDPHPADGATGVPPNQSLTLTWTAGQDAVKHHVYFGDNAELVSQGAAATDRGILTETTFAPGELESLGTYYWRVDEILTDGRVQTGQVWHFATYLVVDDFESYDDEDNRIWNTWIDGWFDGTGSWVGWDGAAIWWRGIIIVHSGHECMPFQYNNVGPPYYSEVRRTWSPVQDWTVNGMDSLVLYVRGTSTNDPAVLYVALEDSVGAVAIVPYSDDTASTATNWLEWKIPLSSFVGVNLARVKTMYIGVGDRSNPVPGGQGIIYIDDISLAQRMP